jgi:hypothetical protein
MSGSISFVGTNNFKQVIHTFCNVARTDLLYHTLHPSPETIARRLKAIWARTWDFSDLEPAKNFVSSELKDIHLNIYMHYSKEINSTDTLDKIKQLAKSSFNKADKEATAIWQKELPTHANEVKDHLRAVWIQAQKFLDHLPLDPAKSAIKAFLTDALVPQSIKKLYLEDLNLANTLEGLKNRLQSYLNDLEVKGKGITSTSLGSQGYPKIIDVQRGERILGFMKTLGNSLEMDYHLLYSFFLNDCLEQKEFHIQVPNASMLDVEKANYVDSSGNRYDISKYNQLIKHLLGSVASLNTEASRSTTTSEELKFQRITQTCPTGFFDLVNGLNLADFFREKYLSLDDEKKNRFCFSAGLIAYLDLILGNQDRFIRLLPDLDEGRYSFFFTEENPIEKSNLGNLMISHDFTQFYAIDNGIGDGRHDPCITREEKTADEKAYTDFLTSNLTLEDFKAIASDYLIRSLTLAIEEAFQEEANYDGKSLQNVLSDISKEDRISSLRKGMDSMEDLLTETILPKWNHAGAEPIKKRLDKDFVQTIQARLDLFASSKNKFKAIEVASSDEEEAELSISPLNNSPLRDLSLNRETPFSPVMSGSKTTAITNIASHLWKLSTEVASKDTLARIYTILNCLETDFLLPQDIQVKIAEIKISDKDSLTPLIENLADSLASIDPSLVSPRLSHLPSWDEEEDPAAAFRSFSPFKKP